MSANTTQIKKQLLDVHRFVTATRRLLGPASGFAPESFDVSLENNIHNGKEPHLTVTFSGPIPQKVASAFLWSLSPLDERQEKIDDERLDAIAREFPDTLYLKEF